MSSSIRASGRRNRHGGPRRCFSQRSRHVLAWGCPFERGANFGDGLVAILIQLLELLLQRPELPGALRLPLPVDVESVGRRRARRLRPRHDPRRLVTTLGGSHLYALQIEGLGRTSLTLLRWHDDFAARCRQGRFDGKRWTPAANARRDLVVLRGFCP